MHNLDELEDGGRNLPTGATVVYAAVAALLTAAVVFICLLT